MSSETKKLKYTVFLIKDEYTKFHEIVDEEKYEDHKTLKERYGIEGILYIGHNEEKQPSWYVELKEGIVDLPSLSNKSTRAVMLIKRRNRIFAFIYGHGKSMIKPETFERGFGMRLVLNNCEVNKLKSVDYATIDSITVQGRTQTSKSSEISNFQIDDTRDLLKAVTAETTDFERYGKIVSGRDSFHFTHYFSFETLKDICDQLMEDFHSNKYKDNFEWIDHLNEERDPVLIEQLNETLVEQLNDIYEEKSEHNIHLAPPEIIDTEANIMYTFREHGDKVDELDLNRYIGEKKPKDKYNVKKLKRDKIFVYSESQNTLIETWSIYNCLITEIQYENKTYILSFGMWYSINNDYITEINEFIQNIDSCSLQFHDYDASIYNSENDYNESVAKKRNDIISMDKKLININGGRFELCDLLSNARHLIHVKPWSSSSTLSHLFSQGRIMKSYNVKLCTYSLQYCIFLLCNKHACWK